MSENLQISDSEDRNGSNLSDSTELVSINTPLPIDEAPAFVLLSPSETVRFWAGRIVAKVQQEGLPGEMGMIGKLAVPFLGKMLGKLESLSDDQAREIIDAVHALSAKIEEQTGEDSPYH